MDISVRALVVSLLVLRGVAAVGAPVQSETPCPPPESRLIEAQRKFHPGHYVSISRAQSREDFSPALSKGIAGVQMRYRWADLEPAEGRYQFSAIAKDLEMVARGGLQLVVLIEDKSFNDDSPTPEYLQGKYTLRNRNRGYTALRWEPVVNDRLRQLVANLGMQFDCNPNFEGVAFQESSLGLDNDVLDRNGYTPEKYRDALIGQLRSASASLPRSRVFWYMNFLPGNQGYLSDIADAVVGDGVVMGGPDVLPDNPSLANRVYPLYDKFKGRLKLFNSMQHDSYRHRRVRRGGEGARYWTMEELFVFARDNLHVDYVFWEYHTRRKPADSLDWTDAQQVIARHGEFDARAETPPRPLDTGQAPPKQVPVRSN